MKYLITAKPGVMPIPPEQGAGLLQASAEWMKAQLEDGSVDCVYNYFGGGGIAIGNGDSHEAVLGNLLKYPLYPFFVWEVVPLLDWNEGIGKYIEFYQRMTS